jgi:hypothetical protein
MNQLVGVLDTLGDEAALGYRHVIYKFRSSEGGYTGDGGRCSPYARKVEQRWYCCKSLEGYAVVFRYQGHHRL